MIVPVVDGVTVAVQLAVVALTTVNGLLQALNVPVAVPPFVITTDPAGVEAVPGEMLSLTRSEEHTTELPSPLQLVYRIMLEKNSVPTVTVLLVAGPLLLWTPSVAV